MKEQPASSRAIPKQRPEPVRPTTNLRDAQVAGSPGGAVAQIPLPLLSPEGIITLQRVAGNQAVQRMLAANQQHPHPRSTHRLPGDVKKLFPSVLQRKVGFEFELSVLADIDGRDAGYGRKLHKGMTTDVTTDHNVALKPMTESASQKDPRLKPYSSYFGDRNQTD